MATTLDSKKRLALAIIDFLSTSLKDGTLTSEDSESIEIATSCIADTFHVDPSNKAHMADAIGSQSLLQIYGVYEKLKGKSTASTTGASSASEGRPATPTTNKDGSTTSSSSKPGTTPAASASSTTSSSPDAELFKSQGNAAMARKDHPLAISLYSKAIALAPTNPIYLSNRAAAYSASSQHDLAATDAEMAVAADPKYTKAWSRLGLARFVLGDARGSMEAYGKGIEFEGQGGSEAMKKGFKTAKEKVEELERESKEDIVAEDVDDAPGSTARSGAAGGGMPDLSALAGMFGGGGGAGGGAPGGGGGGGGGMPDLSGIMNNPMFASMAQNLMQNPEALQGLMNNPQLRQMAERFGLGGAGGGGGGGAGAGAGAGRGGGGAGGRGGAGGGMPDLAAMMQDPSIAEMARNMMGGAGGAGAGRGAGGAGRGS